MSRITSSVGLITGIPIEETVNQLIQVSSRPRNLLADRTKGLLSEQVALDTLSSRLLGLQFSINKFKGVSLFQARSATSSNADALKASVPRGQSPPVGALQVRPVQTAASQQLVSNRIVDPERELGDGEFRFRIGGFLDPGRTLDDLNLGSGVQRGKLKITDRSGASAVIDLSTAQSVDDVLRAINGAAEISVTASTDDGAFVLTDASGGGGNLAVAEVNGGRTAADLGLAGVSVAANVASGASVFALQRNTRLATLNDGQGVEVSGVGIADIEVELSDGTTASIDLSGADTLGDVIDALADDANLAGKIAVSIVDGKRLQVTDLSGGGGSFALTAGSVATALADLGLDGAASGGVIAGRRLASGLKDTLLTSLRGGQGVGELGQLDLTDRSGATASVDLSSAETLDDVIDAINAANVQVVAALDASRGGIVLTDASGGNGSLIVASGDAADTAAKLGIAVNDAVASVGSGALERQTLSRNTLLTDLRGGQAVTVRDLRITDASGLSATVDLDDPADPATTVGDVIDAINRLAIGVEARINDRGDGVLLYDTSGGSGSLVVTDQGAGNVAAALRLKRASAQLDVDGQLRTAIDGTATSALDLGDLGAASPGATLLSTLKGGVGIDRGDFIITDSAGRSLAIDLNGADAAVATVDDLINAINAKATAGGIGVTASLNSGSTGIRLEDSAGGSGKLTVRDVGSGTAAADLRLAGEATLSGGVQTINGTGLIPASSSAQTGLDALAQRINDLAAGVSASVLFDGVGYRLSLTVDASGAANELLLDLGSSELSFTQISRGQDALLAYGDLDAPGGGVLLSSPNNQFKQVIGGVDLTVLAASDAPVSVNVTANNQPVVDAVKKIVEDYNAVRSYLAETTSFDAEAATTGILFGTNAALQVDVRLSRLLTDRFRNSGELQSLAEVGISVNAQGEMELDEAELVAAIEADAAGVEAFFTASGTGFVARFNGVIDGLAGDDSAILLQRGQSLQRTIEDNESRIGRLDDFLERERERLLLEFARLESIIAKFQDSQSIIQNLQVIPPLAVQRSR